MLCSVTRLMWSSEDAISPGDVDWWLDVLLLNVLCKHRRYVIKETARVTTFGW